MPRKVWRWINISNLCISLCAIGLTWSLLFFGSKYFLLPSDITIAPLGGLPSKHETNARSSDAGLTRIAYHPGSNEHAVRMLEYLQRGHSATHAAWLVLRDLLRDDPDVLRGSTTQFGVELVVLSDNDHADDRLPIATFLSSLCVDRLRRAGCLPKCDEGLAPCVDLTVDEGHALRDHIHRVRLAMYGTAYIDRQFVSDQMVQCDTFVELHQIDCDRIQSDCCSLVPGASAANSAQR
jgi:hypothetical protein